MVAYFAWSYILLIVSLSSWLSAPEQIPAAPSRRERRVSGLGFRWVGRAFRAWRDPAQSGPVRPESALMLPGIDRPESIEQGPSASAFPGARRFARHRPRGKREEIGSLRPLISTVWAWESAAISGRIDRATSRLSETESMATKLRREHDVHG